MGIQGHSLLLGTTIELTYARNILDCVGHMPALSWLGGFFFFFYHLLTLTMVPMHPHLLGWESHSILLEVLTGEHNTS